MALSDLTVLHTAIRSIFSGVVEHVEDNLKLRWMMLENELNLPMVITVESMKREQLALKASSATCPCRARSPGTRAYP